jgi:hypothetical protein
VILYFTVICIKKQSLYLNPDPIFCSDSDVGNFFSFCRVRIRRTVIFCNRTRSPRYCWQILTVDCNVLFYFFSCLFRELHSCAVRCPGPHLDPRLCSPYRTNQKMSRLVPGTGIVSLKMRSFWSEVPVAVTTGRKRKLFRFKPAYLISLEMWRRL